MRQMWNVPVRTATVGFNIVVLGYTANDARMNAIEFVTDMYGLVPARWETQPCGKWVRMPGLKDASGYDCPYDGFLCAIDKPYRVGE